MSRVQHVCRIRTHQSAIYHVIAMLQCHPPRTIYSDRPCSTRYYRGLLLPTKFAPLPFNMVYSPNPAQRYVYNSLYVNVQYILAVDIKSQDHSPITPMINSTHSSSFEIPTTHQFPRYADEPATSSMQVGRELRQCIPAVTTHASSCLTRVRCNLGAHTYDLLQLYCHSYYYRGAIVNRT